MPLFGPKKILNASPAQSITALNASPEMEFYISSALNEQKEYNKARHYEAFVADVAIAETLHKKRP